MGGAAPQSDSITNIKILNLGIKINIMISKREYQNWSKEVCQVLNKKSRILMKNNTLPYSKKSIAFTSTILTSILTTIQWIKILAFLVSQKVKNKNWNVRKWSRPSPKSRKLPNKLKSTIERSLVGINQALEMSSQCSPSKTKTKTKLKIKLKIMDFMKIGRTYITWMYSSNYLLLFRVRQQTKKLRSAKI